MGTPQLLLATGVRGSVPMDAELSVCSKRGEERERKRGRGRVSEVTDILMSGWLRSVLAKRMCFIDTILADASTSSKQSVQKTGRGLHVLAT